MECAAPAAVTLRLAAALLELLAAREVHAHAEPTVRRSALVAISKVWLYNYHAGVPFQLPSRFTFFNLRVKPLGVQLLLSMPKSGWEMQYFSSSGTRHGCHFVAGGT